MRKDNQGKANRNEKVPEPSPAPLRCAIYTRKSTEEGLEQEFNSLDAQREAAEAFIQSQRREGWITLPDLYDDGGFTGANMDRPALAKLLRVTVRDRTMLTYSPSPRAAPFSNPARFEIDRRDLSPGTSD
jgi:hypothetical protein